MKTDKLHPAVDDFCDKFKYGSGLTLEYDIEYLTRTSEMPYGGIDGPVRYASFAIETTDVYVTGFKYVGDGFAVSGRIPSTLLSVREECFEHCTHGQQDVEAEILKALNKGGAKFNMSLLDYNG